MGKTFIRQLIDIITGSFFALLMGVVTTPLITRMVAPDVYGQYSLFNTYSSLAMSFGVLGLDQAIGRYFFSSKDSTYKKGLFQFSTGISLVVSTACVFLIVSILQVLGVLENVETLYLLCFCISIPLAIVYRMTMILIRLEYKTTLYSMLNVIVKIAYVVFFMIYLLLVKVQPLYALILAILSADIVCFIIALLSEKEFFRPSASAIHSVQSVAPYKEIIRYALPLIISTGVMHIFQATDRLCIDYFGTAADVGIYASAQSIIGVFSIIQTSFCTLFFPKAVEHFEKDRDDKSFFVKMNAYITVVMFTFGVGVLLFKDVIILVLGEKYRSSAAILPFLLFNPIMYTISETTVQGISFFKKTGKQVYIVSICAVVNLVLNIVLINRIGYVGAAVSTGITYVIFFTLRTVISNRYYPVKFHIGRFYILTACFAAICVYSSVGSNKWTLFAICGAFGLIQYFLYKKYVHELFQYLCAFLKTKIGKKKQIDKV